MSSVAVIADAHVSEMLYTHRPLIKGDSIRALESAVRRILELGNISTVIFAGDNFDSRRPSPVDVRNMTSAIATLLSFGCRVLSIQGNHDSCPLSWMSICGAEDLSGKTITLKDGLTVSGHSYCTGFRFSEMMQWISTLSTTDLLVLHQSMTHLNGFDPNGVDLEDIPDGVRLGVTCGHLHIPNIARSVSERFAVSPGSTHPRSLAELPGSFMVLENGVPRLEPISGNRNIFRFTKVTSEEALQEVLDFLKTLPEGVSVDDMPLVEVRYTSEFVKHATSLESASTKCHIFHSVIGYFKHAEEMYVDMPVPKQEILGKFVPKGSTEHKVLCRLIEDEDTESVLDDVEKTFLDREVTGDAT